MRDLSPAARASHRVTPWHRALARAAGSPNRSTARSIVALAALLASWSSVGQAQTVNDQLWGTDGGVTSIVRDGGTIYVGGGFTRVGPAMGSGVAIDASTGAARQPFPQVVGEVLAIAPDGNGGWFLGGGFRAVRGQPRQGLAHLDAGGSLTAWSPSVTGFVQALVVIGGTVYAGGRFTSVNGQPRSNLVAIDAASGALTSALPDADDEVKDLAVGGGTVYAVGVFTNIGGQPRRYIAALDAATGNATAWDPNPDFGAIFSIAVSGGTVYTSGGFENIGGQPRFNIAALDATTGEATAWNPGSTGFAYALEVSGGTVYAAGNFSFIGGQPRNLIAALDATTGETSAWNPNPGAGAVYSLAVAGGIVYAGGSFTNIGGQPRMNIAALDAVSGEATAWDPRATNTVFTLSASGSTVFAGGGFRFVGGSPRSGLAALDAATGVPTDWSPNLLGGQVRAMVASGGRLYVGGRFHHIDGQSRNRLAAFDLSSGALTAWNPSVLGSDALTSALALAASGTTIYVGGHFSSVGGQLRNNLAALDPVTGEATAWNPDAGTGLLADVEALAVSGTMVYAGGSFTSMGGEPHTAIAAIDATSGAVGPSYPDFAGSIVRALAVSGNTIFAGGSNLFGTGYLAALDATTGELVLNPEVDYNVNALTLQGGTMYVGGTFEHLGGEPRRHLAAIDAQSGTVTDWRADTDLGSVEALAVSGSVVYAGGGITNLLMHPVGGIAAISPVILAGSGESEAGDRILTVGPNPTRARLQIHYAVSRGGHVRLELLDVAGRIVDTLVDRDQDPGSYSVTSAVGQSGGFAPGLYLVRYVSPNQTAMRKVFVIR